MAKFQPGEQVVVKRNILNLVPSFSGDSHVDMFMEDNDARVWLESAHQGFAGKVVTIDEIFVFNDSKCWCYYIKEDNHALYWTDAFFEDNTQLLDVDEADLMEVLAT